MKKVDFFPHLAAEDAFPSAYSNVQHLDCKSNLLLKIDAIYDLKKKLKTRQRKKNKLYKIENQSDKKYNVT